jgi:hypothetical protein
LQIRIINTVALALCEVPQSSKVRVVDKCNSLGEWTFDREEWMVDREISYCLLDRQSITFAGQKTDGPTTVDGVPFPHNHDGFSGYNIDMTQGRPGISPFFPGDITTYKPNLVLLMIGTNDVDTGEPTIPDRLGRLIDSMLMPDPKLLLVVAQIVPQQIPEAGPDTKNMQVQAYNAAIPGVVKTRTDAGKHVAIVDMYGAFTANPNFSTVLLNDRLHPNNAGYAVMADTWYAAIRQYLK